MHPRHHETLRPRMGAGLVKNIHYSLIIIHYHYESRISSRNSTYLRLHQAPHGQAISFSPSQVRQARPRTSNHLLKRNVQAHKTHHRCRAECHTPILRPSRIRQAAHRPHTRTLASTSLGDGKSRHTFCRTTA